MPFTKERRCAHCMHWKQDDPNDTIGDCIEPVVNPRPQWASDDPQGTHYAYGHRCATFEYDAHPEHMLDRATGILMQVQLGDTLTLRTYGIGMPLDRVKARVVRIGQRFVTVSAWNAEYRIRIDDAQWRGRAGMVIGMPDWGLDVDATIEEAAEKQERPEMASKMLSRVQVGDLLKLKGYPPLDGITKMARVYAVERAKVRIKVGRAKRVMHRTGTMAGIIEGDVFVLDTTDAE